MSKGLKYIFELVIRIEGNAQVLTFFSFSEVTEYLNNLYIFKINKFCLECNFSVSLVTKNVTNSQFLAMKETNTNPELF